MTIQEKIAKVKKEKNAVILAHYYQEGDIQDIADFVGDSLELSRKAAATDADIILFAGVTFMAETAKILNPTKKVLVPDMDAGCSLESSCPSGDFEIFTKQHPDHVKVTYINCSAEVKALSDIIVTSSNAEKVIASVPKDKPILFSPDKNLGAFLAKKTGRDMLLWDGECIVHKAFSLEKIVNLCQEFPNAKLIAHPESDKNILDVSHFVGSTSAMLNYVIESDCQQFIVATEAGILHKMSQACPEKELIPAPVEDDNTCACSECHFMKMNTLDKIYNALVNETPELNLEEDLRLKALKPIEKMLAL